MHPLIKSAVCPFFQAATTVGLTCEGFDKVTSMRLRFDSKESMKAHTWRFCTSMNGYTNCPLYPVIMKQYKEDDDDD